MSENLSKAISNNLLYSVREEWPKLDKFCYQRARLPLEFATLPEHVTKALSVVRPRASQVQLMQIDEDRNVVRRPDSQPALTSSTRLRSLIFSVAVWAELKLCTNRSRSKKKGTIYLPTTQKKREATKSLLETGAVAGAQDMTKKVAWRRSSPSCLRLCTKMGVPQ